MTPANPDDEAMRLTDENVEDSSRDRDSRKLAAHVKRLVAEKAEANEGRVAKIVECAILRQENERMRKGLETACFEWEQWMRYGTGASTPPDWAQETPQDSKDKLAICRSLLTPTPAAEAKPKSQAHRSILTHAVYALDPHKKEDRCICEYCGKGGTMAELMGDQEQCPVMVRRYGANADDLVPKTKPKCGRCGGTGTIEEPSGFADGGSFLIPCPDCATPTEGSAK